MKGRRDHCHREGNDSTNYQHIFYCRTLPVKKKQDCDTASWQAHRSCPRPCTERRFSSCISEFFSWPIHRSFLVPWTSMDAKLVQGVSGHALSRELSKSMGMLHCRCNKLQRSVYDQVKSGIDFNPAVVGIPRLFQALLGIRFVSFVHPFICHAIGSLCGLASLDHVGRGCGGQVWRQSQVVRETQIP